MKLYAAGPLLVFFCMPASVLAQVSPPYLIEGPIIVQSGGCNLLPEAIGGKLTKKCVDISYDPSQPTSASIMQRRYVLVPRGNLIFEFPVVSNVVSSAGQLSVDFGVTVTVQGPNPGETATNTGGVTFSGKDSALIQVPINVDWADSVVTFQIDLSQEIIYGPCDPKPRNCVSASGQFTGPGLSSVSLGAIYPSELVPNDGFLVIATPAAGFQLPVLPTTILYAPLGNGSQANSSFTVTNIVGTNQQFTNSQGQTQGLTHDDKNQYQVGVTLSLAHVSEESDVVCAKDSCKLGLGVNYSESWEHSTETDNEQTYGTTESVITQSQTQVQYTVSPLPGQPSLDNVTWATQPFWRDIFLAVTDPQYAVWDYPAGPVIQPLGAASVVVLPVRQLDSCRNAPNAIEPTSFVPAQWQQNQVFAPGTVLVDSNNQIQVATTGGKSGLMQPLSQWQAFRIYPLNATIIDATGNKQTVTKAGLSDSSAPTWTPTINATTNDGSVVWINGGSATGWGFNYGDQTSDGTVTWTNENDQFGVYKSSVALDATHFIQLRTWNAGQAFPTGAMIVGPGLGSIEVATAGGTSGSTAPTWNTADEGTTTDGTITWTNEQDHFTVYAGPVVQRGSVYRWLSSDNCKDVLSLDQFYAKGAQSAYPIAYRVLGNQLSLSPSTPTTYSNQKQTATSVGQNSTAKQTTKVTSVYSNTLGGTGALDFGLKLASFVLGIDVTGGLSETSSTTTVDTTENSQSLQSATTATGQWTASTTIQDSGNEQSIPVNILQDSIFMGIAVQDPSMNPAPPATGALPMVSDKNVPPELQGLPIVPVGRSPAILRKSGSLEPTTYLQQTYYGYAVLVNKPTTASQIREHLQALHAAAAHRHIARVVPPPPPIRVRIGRRQDVLRRLRTIKSPTTPVQDAIKWLEQPTKTP
jgi:hypothetical protein